MGTVTGAGTGTAMTGTGTRIGTGRAEKRRKNARNRKIVVNAVRETGQKRVEREKNVEERVGSVAANPDNVESNKEEGGGAQGTHSSNKNCTISDSLSPLSRLIRGFRNKYH